MQMNRLTREERALINRRANELALKTWEIYRLALTSWAIEHKLGHGMRPLTEDALASVVPDIRDEMGDDKPF